MSANELLEKNNLPRKSNWFTPVLDEETIKILEEINKFHNKKTNLKQKLNNYNKFKTQKTIVRRKPWRKRRAVSLVKKELPGNKRRRLLLNRRRRTVSLSPRKRVLQ